MSSRNLAAVLRAQAMAAFAMLASACGVAEPPPSTGGTDVAMGRCGRGLLVVSSDYQSTNVSLTDTSGAVLSSSLLSSSSEQTKLSAPLSGDVVAPAWPQLGAELVLIDRYPASVLSWVGVLDGQVVSQLDVGTGFAANPQDYLAVSPGRAFVSRYATNPAGGAQPFDQGGDLLMVDPAAGAIVGRVDLAPAMSDAPGFLPRAGHMVLSGDRLLVLLGGYNADFTAAAPSRVVAIAVDSAELIGTRVLDGMFGCAGLAIEPFHAGPAKLAVSCSGKFNDAVASLDGSGVVLLSTETPVPAEIGRWSAADVGGLPLGASVDFIDDHRLLLTAMGSFDPPEPDALIELDTVAGEAHTLLRSEVAPFVFGEVRCMTPLDVEIADPAGACGGCFATDAERGELDVLEDGASGLALARRVRVDTAIGLPPRGLGRF